MPSDFSLHNKAVVVTGGAGHLGRAICYGLVKAGARVLCLSSKAMDVPMDGSITSGVCNVDNKREVEEHVRDFAPIYGLVNCAGRGKRGLEQMSEVNFKFYASSQLAHYYANSHIARDYMIEGGSIVNIASMWGNHAPPFSAYLDLGNEPTVTAATVGAGILAMTKYHAALWAKDGIRVNAVVPGWFPQNRGTPRPDYMEQINARVPMGRIGQPEEIAGPVVFCMSKAASYMTGQTLTIDGGYTCL